MPETAIKPYEIPLGKNRPGGPSFAKPPQKTKAQTGDSGVRETVETVVFVIVLVLLLKTFIAEAFVIPTGSMATTLLGYHIEVTCGKCGYKYVANASSEAEPSPRGGGDRIKASFCENCWAENLFRTEIKGGDQ